jgi:DNA-binding HxlR family transcriptional regulator
MKLEKITKQRRYEDACGTAHALDLVGERWALLVMRELLLGPRRFSDLRASLPGISANVLTQRLEGLEAAAILRRRRLPPPASVQVYELTDWGREAEPVIKGLGRWAARSPGHDPSLPLSAVSMMLSLRTMFIADRAPGPGEPPLTLAFRFGDEPFFARVADGALTADRGEPAHPDAVLAADPAQVAAAVYGFAPLPENALVEGDPAAFDRFAAMFELPEKAGG